MTAFWEDDGAWPKPPREYVFLGAAFREVGEALFSGQWAGTEALTQPDPWEKVKAIEAKKRRIENILLAQKVPKPISSVSRHGGSALPQSLRGSGGSAPGPITPEAEQSLRKEAKVAEAVVAEVLARRHSAAEWIGDRGRNGDILTFLRPVSGGMFRPASPDLWNVEPIWARFANCQVQWGAGEPDYIFVTRDSLDRATSTLPGGLHPNVGPDLSRLSPYLQFAVGLALKFQQFQREGQLTEEAARATAIEEWAKGHPGEILGQTAATAIARVIRHHSPEAIARGRVRTTKG